VLSAAVDNPPVSGADTGEEVEPHTPVSSVAADGGDGRLVDGGVADVQQPEPVSGDDLDPNWVLTVP